MSAATPKRVGVGGLGGLVGLVGLAALTALAARIRRIAGIGMIAGLAVAPISGCGLVRSASSPPPSSGTPPRVEAIPTVVGHQADCRAAFPDQDGWLGGDVAASIPLADGGGDPIEPAGVRRSVWLFGDSFVARPGDPAERRYPFVHNAIAVSRCDARGRFTLDYAWGSNARRGEGVARAYFEPDPRAAWVARIRRETGEAPYYWPLSGVAVGDALHVALLRIAKAPARGPFQLPFRPVGVDLARIEPTSGPPETWRVALSSLSSRGDVLPATSLVVDGGFLLAFATLDRGDGHAPRILVRLPLTALAEGRADLEPFVETLAQDGRWRAGLDPDAARLLMEDDASEMSVHFDPGRGEWIAVYGDPAGDAIWLRRAPRPEGPWSARIPLLRIPELARAEDPEAGEPFCYAGKAHPELAPSGELVVSYVCNLFTGPADPIAAVLERLRTTTSIYRPKLVRVPIPAE